MGGLYSAGDKVVRGFSIVASSSFSASEAVSLRNDLVRADVVEAQVVAHPQVIHPTRLAVDILIDRGVEVVVAVVDGRGVGAQVQVPADRVQEEAVRFPAEETKARRRSRTMAWALAFSACSPERGGPMLPTARAASSSLR